MAFRRLVELDDDAEDHPVDHWPLRSHSGHLTHFESRPSRTAASRDGSCRFFFPIDHFNNDTGDLVFDNGERVLPFGATRMLQSTPGLTFLALPGQQLRALGLLVVIDPFCGLRLCFP